jgi:hypothetical protein
LRISLATGLFAVSIKTNAIVHSLSLLKRIRYAAAKIVQITYS